MPMIAAVRIGKASRISRLVTSVFQVKIGIRNMVIPGARRQTIVVMKLTPPRIVPRPLTARPAIQRFGPAPGGFVMSDSGVYAVQPKSAAPPGVRRPETTNVLPNRNSQNDKAFSRG